MWENYRNTSPGSAKSILNIEELATVFHFPITAVSTTELKKIASRKGSLADGLAVDGRIEDGRHETREELLSVIPAEAGIRASKLFRF